MSFYSDRERLLRYFLAHPAKFYIPFTTKRSMLNSSLVLLGRKSEHQYSLKTVISHYNEVRAALARVHICTMPQASEPNRGACQRTGCAVHISCTSRAHLVHISCSSRAHLVHISCSSRAHLVLISCTSPAHLLLISCSSPAHLTRTAALGGD